MRLTFLALLAGVSTLAAQAPGRRPFALDDLARVRQVSAPVLAPGGDWVAYTVGTANLKKDRWTSDLWMTSWDGATTLQLTRTADESEHTPRWRPDGQALAFLSSRDSDEDDELGDQLWLLDRRGGEAERITELKGGIDDYAWSPDGTRMVLVISDRDTVETLDALRDVPRDSTWPEDTPPPLIIDRYYFKEDYTGYVRKVRSHLYLFDVATRSVQPLTAGGFDEVQPAWSPDGKRIAFVSKRAGTDPDRTENWDIYVMDATPGATARAITTFTGPDLDPDWGEAPEWSADGRTILYHRNGPDSLIYYAGPRLATVPAAGGTERVLTEAFDRHTMNPRWSADGRSIYFRIEDDRRMSLARMPAGGGAPELVVTGRVVVNGYDLAGDRIAVLVESMDKPGELYAVGAGGQLRALTHQNDSLLATLDLVSGDDLSARSKDGTQVNGLLVKPLHYTAGTRVPTVLKVHGGPVAQFDYSFDPEFQLYAANGYAVVAMNPRGSSGRGEKYSLAIWADWGNKDVQDVLAGVDQAVAMGVADPDRLGVGGWSYGGILTNYIIASTTRFKAATSGAGISNILAGYGTDMYVREYEYELGAPWKNTATWLRLSYPFLHADRIKTPTLFQGAAADFNVPLLNTEQMYQAVRSLGVPTRLIIYPGQNHGLSKPSYQRHRYAQYLGWFGEWLK
ncbi:MAG: S9 family peptidase [Gemmatimonadetes bacterium]|nr:S9 family peptidase [Gemmatimonadota bacterium]